MGDRALAPQRTLGVPGTPRTVRRRDVTTGVLVVAALTTGIAFKVWVDRLSVIRMPTVAELDLMSTLPPDMPLTVTIYAGGEYAPWSTTESALLRSRALW